MASIMKVFHIFDCTPPAPAEYYLGYKPFSILSENKYDRYYKQAMILCPPTLSLQELSACQE